MEMIAVSPQALSPAASKGSLRPLSGQSPEASKGSLRPLSGRSPEASKGSLRPLSGRSLSPLGWAVQDLELVVKKFSTANCRWLPKKFKQSTNTKRHVGRPIRNNFTGGIDCKLPYPIDEIVAFMPGRERPDAIILAGIVRAKCPEKAFVLSIANQKEVKKIGSPPYWDNSTSSLDLRSFAGSGGLSATHMAIATVHHRSSCKRLELGRANTELDMLSLWTELRYLSIANASQCPSYLPPTLVSLSLDFQASAEPKLIEAKTFPETLCEAKIKGGRAEGLIGLVEGCLNLRFVDCSYWSGARRKELLPVARTLIARGGLLAWPSGNVLRTEIDGLEIEERNLIRSKAHEAALHLLHLAREKAQIVMSIVASIDPNDSSLVANEGGEVFGEAEVVTFASALRYAKEMRVGFNECEEAQATLQRLQARVFARKHKNLANRLTRIQGTTQAQSRWRRSLAVIKTLGAEGLGTLFRGDCLRAMIFMGIEEERANELMMYADCERKGFLNLEDFSALFDRCVPATPEEMYAFWQFIMRQYDSVPNAFRAMDRDCNKEISFREFEAEMNRVNYKKIPHRSLFVALDSIRWSGSLSLEEFELISFYKNVHALATIEKIRDFLLDKCPSLEKAFKILDPNKSGAVTLDEFVEGLQQMGYPASDPVDKQWVCNAFSFIDNDNSGILSHKEFVSFKDFKLNAFLRDLMQLRELLLMKFNNLDNAFKQMDCVIREGGTITKQEFIIGCDRIKLSNLTPTVDPTMLYHFLDSSHDGTVSKKEWMRLRTFNGVAAQKGIQESINQFRTLLGTTDPEMAFKQFKHQIQAAEAASSNPANQLQGN